MNKWSDSHSYIIMTMLEEVTEVEFVHRSTEFMGSGACFDSPMYLSSFDGYF